MSLKCSGTYHCARGSWCATNANAPKLFIRLVMLQSHTHSHTKEFLDSCKVELGPIRASSRAELQQFNELLCQPQRNCVTVCGQSKQKALGTNLQHPMLTGIQNTHILKIGQSVNHCQSLPNQSLQLEHGDWEMCKKREDFQFSFSELPCMQTKQGARELKWKLVG